MFFSFVAEILTFEAVSDGYVLYKNNGMDVCFNHHDRGLGISHHYLGFFFIFASNREILQISSRFIFIKASIKVNSLFPQKSTEFSRSR